MTWPIPTTARFNPKTQSPGAGFFFKSIAGFDDVSAGKADAMSGIQGCRPADDRDHALKTGRDVPAGGGAQLLGASSPQEDVDKWGYRLRPPIRTAPAPFYLDSWTLGQELVFKRNPDYYLAGQPYLDELDFKIGAEPLDSTVAATEGRWIRLGSGDGIPPAKFLEIMNDRDQKKLVVQAPQLETSYLTIKTTMKPLDDVRVPPGDQHGRSTRTASSRSSTAAPMSQHRSLPPGMPGLRQGL